jgi:PIN domain nuclease of toxin-antitoxin system
VILLDTHVWLWWVTQSTRLSPRLRSTLQASRAAGLAVSPISVWEIALKVQAGKIELDRGLDPWLESAMRVPDIRFVEITTEILLESTRLPGSLHRDPADRIIIATARLLDLAIVTEDAKILAYPHVAHL